MEDGYPLADHLGSNLGFMLDESFQSAYELTYTP